MVLTLVLAQKGARSAHIWYRQWKQHLNRYRYQLLGFPLPRLATLFKNITCAGTNYINVIEGQLGERDHVLWLYHWVLTRWPYWSYRIHGHIDLIEFMDILILLNSWTYWCHWAHWAHWAYWAYQPHWCSMRSIYSIDLIDLTKFIDLIKFIDPFNLMIIFYFCELLNLIKLDRIKLTDQFGLYDFFWAIWPLWRPRPRQSYPYLRSHKFHRPLWPIRPVWTP